MKILKINNCHFRRGGADVVYLNTGILLEENNDEVLYFSVKNKKNFKNSFNNYFVNEIDFFEKSFFKKFYLFFRFIYSFESKRKLQLLIDKHKPDIAHIHLYKGGLTSSVLGVLKKNKIPIVFTAHDYGLLDPHNRLLDGKNRIFENTINGSSFHSLFAKSNRNSYIYSFISLVEYLFNLNLFRFDKYFDKVIAVSKFQRDKLRESKKFKFSIMHLYNFYPQIEKINCNYKKGNYFLYFGRISKEKGINTMIKAFLSLRLNFSLKIVGSNEENLISETSKNIEILGFKNEDDLIELIKGSSFVLLPSEWYENNPLTIIESYAQGKPVIASNIGGITEIVNDNETGFLFKSGDYIDLKSKIEIALKINKNSYKRLSKNARNFALENFNSKLYYSKLKKIYTKTINNYK